MVKMWDAKLVKMRNEMNISNIVKRIGDKADSSDITDAFDKQNTRIELIE